MALSQLITTIDTNNNPNISVAATIFASQVTGGDNIAIGDNAAQSVITTSASVFLGVGADVQTDGIKQGVAIGNSATINADMATALGYNSTATGKNSTAIGANTTAANENTVVLGDNCYVGIGTNAPLSGLHLGGANSAIYMKATTAALPTIATNDGLFFVQAGVPTFANSSGNHAIITTGGATSGTGTLVSGTVSIAAASVTVNSLIFLTRTSTTGTIATVGTINVASVNAGTDFTVNSSVATDVGSFNYLIIG